MKPLWEERFPRCCPELRGCSQLQEDHVHTPAHTNTHAHTCACTCINTCSLEHMPAHTPPHTEQVLISLVWFSFHWVLSAPPSPPQPWAGAGFAVPYRCGQTAATHSLPNWPLAFSLLQPLPPSDTFTCFLLSLLAFGLHLSPLPLYSPALGPRFSCVSMSLLESPPACVLSTWATLGRSCSTELR